MVEIGVTGTIADELFPVFIRRPTWIFLTGCSKVDSRVTTRIQITLGTDVTPHTPGPRVTIDRRLTTLVPPFLSFSRCPSHPLYNFSAVRIYSDHPPLRNPLPLHLPLQSPTLPTMRRTSSAFVRRTHSSSISRQAQMLPTIPPPPSSEMRTPPTPTPGPPGTEKVKEWVDIFDGPMRPAVFVPSSPSSPPPSSPSMRDNDSGVSSIVFDGPARPRYIIPGAYIQPPTITVQSQRRNRNEPGSPSSTQSSDVSALLSRSSLPPPRIYDGPAFEWELQTKRV